MGPNNKGSKEEFDANAKNYYETISKKPKLRLPIFNYQAINEDNDSELCLPMKSATILWIVENYGFYKWIDISFIKSIPNSEGNGPDEESSKNPEYIKYSCKSSPIISELNFFQNSASLQHKEEDSFAKFSCSPKRPLIIVEEKQLLITGLGSVLRFILKYVYMKLHIQNLSLVEEHNLFNFKETVLSLLGFRTGCLQAPAEVSMWTKFCEVDIFKGFTEARKNTHDSTISQELVRFEYHLQRPLKIHNIKKQTSLHVEKLKALNETEITELKHDFAEGSEMLLSDLIIYPCMSIFCSIYGEETLCKLVPKTFTWLSKMNDKFEIASIINVAEKARKPSSTIWNMPNVVEGSLYKSDKSRYNPATRAFTKQSDVQEALDFVKNAEIPIFNVTDVSTHLNWDNIPILAQPEGGGLPEKRRERKCQQLSSMVVEVMKVVAAEEEKAKRKNISSPTVPLRIIDFCSGGGHVGILLAWLLPKCQIILVENKEDSLRRGWDRIERLGLTNILLYQCNLDYFDSQFEIGVALHGCGIATDLVLSTKCIAAKASFICIPCCYGGISSNFMLDYPRSCLFRESGISLKHYYTLAHASDQTHDEKNEKTEQGKLCMQLIDTDRCLNGKENGYQVCLKRINPETASPKNHIIIGISPI